MVVTGGSVTTSDTSDRRWLATLILLLFVGLAVRLWGAWRANLIHDETTHLGFVDTVRFDLSDWNTPLRTVDHPMLSAYVVCASRSVFGDHPFGLRLLHALVGTATILTIFLLTCQASNRAAGLAAAALLAVDQFHASWSRLFMPEVLLLFFASLVLWQFLRAQREPTTAAFACLGVFLGCSYLAKETAVLLFPILWLAALWGRDTRRWLLSWRWWLAHGICAAIVAPDIVYNLLHFDEGYFHRDSSLMAATTVWSLKPLSLLVGELFIALVDPAALDVDYGIGGGFACYWPAGLFYLLSVTVALASWRQPGTRLLLLSFTLVFVFFLFLPAAGFYDPYWWASLCLLPAVALAGGMAARIWCRVGWVRPALLIGWAWLALHTTVSLTRPGEPWPRRSPAWFAQRSVAKAQWQASHGLLEDAEATLYSVLRVTGPRAEIYRGLAIITARRGQPERAARFHQRFLALQNKATVPNERSGGTGRE